MLVAQPITSQPKARDVLWPHSWSQESEPAASGLVLQAAGDEGNGTLSVAFQTAEVYLATQLS